MQTISCLQICFAHMIWQNTIHPINFAFALITLSVPNLLMGISNSLYSSPNDQVSNTEVCLKNSYWKPCSDIDFHKIQGNTWEWCGHNKVFPCAIFLKTSLSIIHVLYGFFKSSLFLHPRKFYFWLPTCLIN